jgi:hypothetical protein
MSADDELDPLSIGRCAVASTHRQIPPMRIINLPTSASAGLFSEARKEPKSPKSLREVSKSNRQAFESDLPDEGPPPVPVLTDVPPHSNSVPRINRSDPDPESFVGYLRPEKRLSLSYILSRSRRNVYQSHLNVTQKLLSKLRNALNTCVLSRCEQMRQIAVVGTQLENLFRRGVDGQRRAAALRVIYHRKMMKLLQLRADGVRRDIARTVGFSDFLKNMLERESNGDVALLPAVDIGGFEKSLGTADPLIHRVEKRILYLRSHLRELVQQRPGSGDWEFNILHLATRSGKIIWRFEQRVSELTYDDVFMIIDHLSEDKTTLRRVEGLLFDLAWIQQQYPFAGPSHPPRIPVGHGLFPAAIASTAVLRQDFAFVTFSTLNGADWPFRSAVDRIFEMMVLTNPFDIARVFWDVIQDITKCMQGLMAADGQDPEDVEIDFDSLFPILMIVVFAFGLDEWMKVALYTVAFNEQVVDDPQLQFAMTYLEGLLTQIIALDVEELNRKAAEIRRAREDLPRRGDRLAPAAVTFE